MSNKIYLSPSNQTANVGAYVNTNECEQCILIAQSAKAYLDTNYDCNVVIAEQKDNMSTRTAKAKDFGADVYVAIHTNAFSDKTVSGTETYYHSTDASGKELAVALLDSVSALTGKKRRTKTNDALIELNSLDCQRAYVEVDFHSNPEKASWIVSNTSALGKAIGETVATHMKLNKKAPLPEEEVQKQVADDNEILSNAIKYLEAILGKLKA